MGFNLGFKGLTNYKILSNICCSRLFLHTDGITDNHLCWYWHNNWSHIVPSSNTWEKWKDFKI